MTITAVPDLPPLRTHRFTVEQYERLGERGVLMSGERVELLEGWIVDKMTQYPPHSSGIDYALDALRERLPADWRLRDQKPIRTADSMPEPDIAVVRGPRERYLVRHPAAADIGALIEVADSSLPDDRGRKKRIYARARIAVYWIINLLESSVEVYTHPRAGRSPDYRHCQVYRLGQEVPLVLDGCEVARIAVRELIPPLP